MNLRMIALSITVLSTSAYADDSAYLYNCEVLKADASSVGNESITISIEGQTSLTLSDRAGTFKLAEGYNPHQANQNYVEFAGVTDADGYANEVIVPKKMLTGAEDGFVRIRARGEGYFSARYRCQID